MIPTEGVMGKPMALFSAHAKEAQRFAVLPSEGGGVVSL